METHIQSYNFECGLKSWFVQQKKEKDKKQNEKRPKNVHVSSYKSDTCMFLVSFRLFLLLFEEKKEKKKVEFLLSFGKTFSFVKFLLFFFFLSFFFPFDPLTMCMGHVLPTMTFFFFLSLSSFFSLSFLLFCWTWIKPICAHTLKEEWNERSYKKKTFLFNLIFPTETSNCHGFLSFYFIFYFSWLHLKCVEAECLSCISIGKT